MTHGHPPILGMLQAQTYLARSNTSLLDAHATSFRRLEELITIVRFPARDDDDRLGSRVHRRKRAAMACVDLVDGQQAAAEQAMSREKPGLVPSRSKEKFPPLAKSNCLILGFLSAAGECSPSMA